MRKLLAIVTLASMLLGGIAASADKHMLLVTLENPPMEFLAPNGRASGFNVDIAREVCRRMGYTTEIQIVPWQRALNMVKHGQADGIIDAAFSSKRAKYLRYPLTPINAEHYYAYQRSDSDIRLDPDLAEAGSLRTGILRGSFYGRRLSTQLTNGTFGIVEDATSPEHNIRKLISHRVDIIIDQPATVQWNARKLNVLDKIKPVLSRQDENPLLLSVSGTYLAFSRKTASSELINDCNVHLKIMRDDGFFEKAKKAYGILQ